MLILPLPALPPQPKGFRRMPSDPVTSRRIYPYFKYKGCTAGARCASMHVKVRERGREEGRIIATASVPSSTSTSMCARATTVLKSILLGLVTSCAYPDFYTLSFNQISLSPFQQPHTADRTVTHPPSHLRSTAPSSSNSSLVMDTSGRARP